MLKISKETCELVDELVALREKLDDRLRQESGGAYGLCGGADLHVQLHATGFHQHDLAELEAFVGPIRPRHEYEDGSKSYNFMLGNDALGIILMPVGTTDSRMTGGEADDVCTNEEA